MENINLENAETLNMAQQQSARSVQENQEEDRYLLNIYMHMFEESIKNKESYEEAKDKVKHIITKPEYESVLKGNDTVYDYFSKRGLTYQDGYII